MKFKLLLIGCLGIVLSSKSQSVQSPYTINGIGEISSLSFAQNAGMGGVGVSYGNVWYINNQNPALLTTNLMSSFQMGIQGDSRSVSNGDINERTTSGNLRYLAFSWPVVSGKYTTSIGLLPYSSVNYNVTNSEIINGSGAVVNYNFRGDGGLSQAFWAHGVKIVKGVSVGLRASYVFGAIQNEILATTSNETAYLSAYDETTTYSDANFSAGLYLRKSLNEDYTMHFGMTYDLSTSLQGERLGVLQRRNFANQISPIDTIINTTNASFNLPTSITFGATLEKLNKFTFGVELNIQDWSSDAGFANDNTKFNNKIRFSVGGEYVPDYIDVNSYLNRISYRAGFTYENSPYLVNNQQINDLGVSFGLSLPVSLASSLDMAFKVGQNGTLANDLIRERYFKITIGATVNDRWFVRRKYD
jgi:hypothetical protein